MAVLPGCDDPFTCPGSFQECSTGVCIDITTSDEHCGACGEICDTDQHCDSSVCVPNLVCTAPELNCGNECVDTDTSLAHCGACDEPCAGGFDDCVGGECAAPLAAIQTYLESKGDVARDLHVLRDLTYALTKINDTTFNADRVLDHVILPDGRILFVAAQTEGDFALYMASPRGGAITRVSGTPVVTDSTVQPGIAVSADGTKVLYRADADTTGVVELYAVSLANPGVAVKVNGALVASGEVSRVFALSADGRRATYIADADTDDVNELYTVDLSAAAPGTPVKLNATASTDDVWDFEMTPDGARVIYRLDPTNGDLELHVANVASPGTSDVVGYADSANGHADGYHLSPDGTALAFTAGAYLSESLWYVDLTTAAPYTATRLADGRYESANDQWHWVDNDLAFTPDGDHVVFRQVDDAFSFSRLYTVPVASPGTAAQLSAAGTTSADEVTDFAISPDGTAVVYRGGGDGAEGGNPRPRFEGPPQVDPYAPALYHVVRTAATPTPDLLSEPPVVGNHGIAFDYLFVRDGRVLYRADEDVSHQLDAYLIDPASSDLARKVSPPLDQTSDATDVGYMSRFR